MTEQDIRDRLVAEFDKSDNPDRSALKNRCREAAEVQWWAQHELELLHIFNSPRCALTENQFEAGWNTVILSQIHWPTIRENTVAEAIARDQLNLLRGSLVDMIRFFGADNQHGTDVDLTEPLDSLDMVTLLKLNKLGTSEPSQRRYKKKWGAIAVEGTNNQRFRFRKSILKENQVSLLPSWETIAE